MNTVDGFAVFVACECSQVVCKSFRALGVQAFSCDLSPSYGGYPQWHILGDCLDFINGHCSFQNELGECFVIRKSWSLVIAHPPCTYLSNAGARYLYDGNGGIRDFSRYNKGLAARDFFYSCLNCECDHVCVENPGPSLIWRLPRPSQVIQPYFFGDPYSKRTCLWLRGLFPLVPDYQVEPVNSWCSIHKSARVRSQTFQGVADAMAWSWSIQFGGVSLV